MNNSKVLLGVNIDHIATLRQSRGTRYPDPVTAAVIAEQSGADSITFHLREDRRHIQLRDCHLLKQMVQTKLNLEMAVTDEMVDFALELQPHDCCLVPEKREELTTEGGLDVIEGFDRIKQACERLAEKNIRVSLFIDANKQQIDAAVACKAPIIEIHTGHFADAQNDEQRASMLDGINDAIQYAHDQGLQVNAGHGLHYHNVQDIACNPLVVELNIGHAIIADAVFHGLAASVGEMKRLIVEARGN
ncbi:MAG: pyridoxine 5'-phosphate synthase [Gammaproteobacteria bacterium]|jgi:pyridoxine 5-phosphate synthase|nr:pyridoxine 5'-phosphate synthase [Gammaproteobacteria bacterium]MBT3722006.1 pyridoxine 5'-phosphate synthase [Gammaproteobacteria bacterium]MBT4075722.1 pyridoxine 5'-phosphate synthase [Gammaproteobacteria bacterium]MBT4196811.1 pyridoxine 5'-phosphate synthase [Gammaproteobacteria bacterium]MBT4449130.1 pyridoxine 5'-phosphate synthase [Gammaproteobacteria bacterium]